LEQRPHRGLYSLQRAHGLRLQAVEPRRLLRGAQPDERELCRRRAGGRVEPALLRARRWARLLRRCPVEVEVMRRLGTIGIALLLLPASATAAEVRLGARSELTHPGKGHEVHVSAPAVAAVPDGTVLLTWAAEEGREKHVYVAPAGGGGARAGRV